MKGKWEVDKSGYRTKNGGLCVMNGNDCIAIVGDGNTHHPIEVNALLISKAPEMLEMLKESTEVIKWYMENSTSELSEPFFNIGANQIDQIEQLIKQATEL